MKATEIFWELYNHGAIWYALNILSEYSGNIGSDTINAFA